MADAPSESTRDEIRAQLVASLTAQDTDFSKVVELAGLFAATDRDNVRFSIDAGLISRLGRELVSRQETAVAELIKNAYDADAPRVDLIFSDTDAPGGQLEIADYGTGMTRDELQEGFMRLSATTKVREPVSPLYGRHRAGRKGIGRFAVQRLGRQLEIVTQKAGAPDALRVEIDWDQFEPGRELATIASRIETVPPRAKPGTTLLISDLRDKWTEAAIRRVYRFVTDLVQPFPLSDREGATDEDPGFAVDIFRKEGGDLAVIADDETQIFSFAVAKIEAHVDEEGWGHWKMTPVQEPEASESLSWIGKQDEGKAVPYQSLRSARLVAYYFIYVQEYISASQRKAIQKMAGGRGGIRVYRNGFRVRPYGETTDDWLRLDESTRRREILPPHANNNFFGFVEIEDREGVNFEETSSREGLIESDAFRELQDFGSRVLKAAALRVAEARSKKGTTNQKDWGKGAPTDDVRAAADELEAAIEETEDEGEDGAAAGTGALKKAAAGAAATLRRAADAQDAIDRALLEEIGMLRVLASLGLVIGEFTHEVSHTLGSAATGARRLVGMLPEGSEARVEARALSENVQRFKTYASYFYQAFADNASRDLVPLELGTVLVKFRDVVLPAASSMGTTIEEVQFDGLDLYTTPMHSSEWVSVLFNFYSNAQKAIKRARAEGSVHLRAGRGEGTVFVEVADDGDGIPEDLHERVFNAFYTTSSSSSTDEADDFQGSGLGLKIVRDIATAYKGTVEVVSPPEGYSTCFRFEVPAATAEELEELT